MTDREDTTLTVGYFDTVMRGAGWLGNFGRTLLGYKQTTGADGGYLSAGISFSADSDAMGEWMEAGLGRHIAVTDPGIGTCWEGFVNSVEIAQGGKKLSIGPLLDMITRLQLSFSVKDTSTDPPTIGTRIFTSNLDDAVSLARYGVLHRIQSVNSATPAEAGQLAARILADYRNPKRAGDISPKGGKAQVTLSCLGYYHWLKVLLYNSALTGTANASTKIRNVILAQPFSLFEVNDLSLIQMNTWQVSQSESKNRTFLTVIRDAVKLGDASNNRWLFGVTNGRRVYYKPIPTTAKYQYKISGQQQAMYLYGTKFPVKPYAIQAGEWVFDSDFMVGRSPVGSTYIGDDPRYDFIETASFSLPNGWSVSGRTNHRSDQLISKMMVRSED